MLISKMLSQVEHEGGAVVLPMYLCVYTVKADQFHEYKNQLSQLVAKNIDEVCNHISTLDLYTGPMSDAAAALAG